MISDRIRSLLAEMTPAEKLGQLQIVFRPDLVDAAELVRQGIGSIFWPQSAAASNALQREAVENTRLGIPILIGLDVIHGQRTIAPVPLGQAASFDDLIEVVLRRLHEQMDPAYALVALLPSGLQGELQLYPANVDGALTARCDSPRRIHGRRPR